MIRLMYDSAGGRAIGSAIDIPANAGEAYKVGEALVISGGKATKCGAAVKPTHICSQNLKADESDHVIAYPISGTMVFETVLTAAPASLATGSKVTLAADGLGVTATTSNGVAEIVDLRGATKVGDLITIKF